MNGTKRAVERLVDVLGQDQAGQAASGEFLGHVCSGLVWIGEPLVPS